jgi:hypothetical protein
MVRKMGGMKYLTQGASAQTRSSEKKASKDIPGKAVCSPHLMQIKDKIIFFACENASAAPTQHELVLQFVCVCVNVHAKR